MEKPIRFLAHELPAYLIKILQRLSLFSSPQFLSLWETFGGNGVYWAREENNLISIITGVEYGSGMLTRFQSMPDGIYTFPFTLNPNRSTHPSAEQMVILLDAIAKHGYYKVWLYDFMNCLPVVDQFSCGGLETHTIDIARPDWEPPDATLRSEIRKAERENIQVVSFDRAKHREQFLQLMEQTERRHNRNPKYSPAFFDALANLAEHDSRVIWKYCDHEGTPAASHIFLIEDLYALHWQVYFDKQFSWLKPNQYILFQTIRELQKRGIHTISLGASPDDAEGLRSYKERWGGELIAYRRFYRASWLGKLV